MPLSVDFSVTQSIASPNELTFTDLSVGSDATITGRRIYITTAQGNYLVVSGNTNNYSNWPLPLATAIVLAVLSQATSPTIKVDWLAGGTVVYTKTKTFAFNIQLYLALYGLTQNQISAPGIVQDNNYYWNKIQLMVNTKDSEDAITYAGDVFNSQNSADRGTHMVLNSNLFF